MHVHAHQSGEDEVGSPSKVFLNQESSTIAKKKTIENLLHRIS
jgi:hypothetical protein